MILMSIILIEKEGSRVKAQHSFLVSFKKDKTNSNF